jgi:aspartate aminotransferase
MLQEYRRRRDFVIEKLQAIPGASCTVPRGAFYAYPNVGAFLSSDAGGKRGRAGAGAPSTNELAKKLLREAGVAVVPGEAFGTEEHFRLSYATSMEVLAKGLERLKDFLSRQSN